MFICILIKEEVGLINNWMDLNEVYKMFYLFFDGFMKGRIMYVVLYLMGFVGLLYLKVGIEFIDSIYVVLNFRIMVRIGDVVFKVLGNLFDFVKGFYFKVMFDLEKRYICYFL